MWRAKSTDVIAYILSQQRHLSRDGVMLDILFKSFSNLVRTEFNNEAKYVKSEVKLTNSAHRSNTDRI